jgi:hypothetical protein
MMAPVEDQTTGGAGWVVPGTPADQAGSGGPPAPVGLAPAPAAAGDGLAGRPPGAVPRIALRPMTVADVLDGGFGIVKGRPRKILGITAAFIVPIQLLAAFSQRNATGVGVGGVFSADPATSDASGDVGPLVGVLVAALLSAVALTCVTAAVAHLVGQWTMGRDAPAGEILGIVGRRLGGLVVGLVISVVIVGLGFLACYLGALFIAPLVAVLTPALIVEGIGPFAAFARSARLAQTRYWGVLGISLLIGIVSYLLNTALSALPQALAAFIGLDVAWPLLALGGIAANLVVVPFAAAAVVLLYLDLRVRSEGLDIEMSARDVLDRAT